MGILHFISQQVNIMTLGVVVDQKRKSMDSAAEENATRGAKVFKEASEFFDQDSTVDGDVVEATSENDIVIQKETIKTFYSNVIKSEPLSEESEDMEVDTPTASDTSHDSVDNT